MTRLIARAAVLATGAFLVLGPLASLGVWSLAERWTAGSPWPQRVGLKYWSRMLTADFLEPLRLGLVIALTVTALALVLAIPLGYALARVAFPGRALVLLAFLMPQAFPQLPVFASATREFYRFGLAGTLAGVVLVHLVGALVFAVWTMTAVFRALAPWTSGWPAGTWSSRCPWRRPASPPPRCSCSSIRSTSSPAPCSSARRS